MYVKKEICKNIALILSEKYRYINNIIIDSKINNCVFLKDDELKEYKNELQNLQNLANKIGFTLK